MSQTHMLPSEPSAMPAGRAALSGSVYSVYGGPVSVICATLATLVSVNHMLRFGPGPAAMPFGPALRVGVTASETCPRLFSWAILLAVSSVIQRLASAPRAMPAGWADFVGIGYWAVTAGEASAAGSACRS